MAPIEVGDVFILGDRSTVTVLRKQGFWIHSKHREEGEDNMISHTSYTFNVFMFNRGGAKHYREVQ